MFEVGDRIVRKSNESCGWVVSVEKRRAWMLEVKWDAPIGNQWLPAEEFREWKQSDVPPPPAKMGYRGRTTPEYIANIRRSRPFKENTVMNKRLAQQKLADDLASLSGRKKQRTNNKAKNLIANYEKGIYPVNMTKRIRCQQEQAEHDRKEMSRNWKRNHKLTREEKRAYAKSMALSRKLDQQMKGAIERDSLRELGGVLNLNSASDSHLGESK